MTGMHNIMIVYETPRVRIHYTHNIATAERTCILYFVFCTYAYKIDPRRAASFDRDLSVLIIPTARHIYAFILLQAYLYYTYTFTGSIIRRC